MESSNVPGGKPKSSSVYTITKLFHLFYHDYCTTDHKYQVLVELVLITYTNYMYIIFELFQIEYSLVEVVC